MSKCKLNLINYIGGKGYLTETIIRLLDYNKKCYVELFGGSAKVLLNKPKHLVEWYNDKNRHIYTLMKVIANRYDEFANKLRYVLYHETLFEDACKSVDFLDDEVEIAIAVFLMFNMSFSAKGQSFGFSVNRNHAFAFANKIKDLEKIFDRLRDVVFFNRDYKDILEMVLYRDDIMIYADPPYYDKEQYYDVSFDKKDHLELAKMLNEAKGSVLISYYPFNGIEELYPRSKWRYYEVQSYLHSRGVTKSTKVRNRFTVKELLITNYESEDELCLIK